MTKMRHYKLVLQIINRYTICPLKQKFLSVLLSILIFLILVIRYRGQGYSPINISINMLTRQKIIHIITIITTFRNSK